MGLLSHMEAIRARDLEFRTLGANGISSQKKKIVDYHSFSERAALRQSAVLVPFGKRFFMRYEHGFDAASIFKSISSIDFWNGTVPQHQKWHTFTGDELEPFYQLFSNDVVHNLTHIHVKSFVILADVPIKAIMIATDAEIERERIDDFIPNLADFIAADISNVGSIMSAPFFSGTPLLDCGSIFTISTKEAIAEVADSFCVDAEALDLLFPVILSETNNRIRKILSSTDYCFPGNEFKISIIFSQASSLDADLLQFQLQKHFVSLFGASTSKIIVESTQS